MRRLALTLFGLSGLGWLTALAAAAPEADPNKEYRLSPKEGPYMIYIATYRGDDPNLPAYDQARKLVHELRSSSDYKFEAYMYSRSEQEKAAREQQLKELHDRLGDGQHIKVTRVVEEWAVLIGNFPTREAATDFLYSTIKEKPDRTSKGAPVPLKAKLPPPKSVHGSGEFLLDNGDRNNKSVTSAGQVREVNPFTHALVVRNPLRGEDTQIAYETAQAMAAKVEAYNVSKCPKQFTLVVKGFKFTGDTKNGGSPSWLERNNPFSSADSKKPVLVGKPEAIAAAVQLADTLRAKNLGHEPYLYVTDDLVMVSVGGFNIPADNKTLEVLWNKVANAKVGEFQLNDQPTAMLVPRK